MKKGGYADYIFLDLLQDGAEKCKSAGHHESSTRLENFLRILREEDKKEAVESKPQEDDADDSSDRVNAEQERLFRTGNYVQALLASCPGDAARLKSQLCKDLREGKVNGNELMHVVKDNISACRAAGYVNKVKVFEFMVKTCEEEMQAIEMSKTIIGKEKINDTVVDGGDVGVREGTAIADHTDSTFTQYHAPKFIDRVSPAEEPVHRTNADLHLLDFALDASCAFPYFMKDPTKNNKKKDVRRGLTKRMKALVTSVNDRLRENGVAVCDNVVPLDTVRRVRIEANLFMEHYEPAEIWVGKTADVGAQLSVPSVRGAPGGRVSHLINAHFRGCVPCHIF